MAGTWLRGIFPPIPTAFASGGSIAGPVSAFLEHLAASGVDGVVVLGSNGEAPLLSDDERTAWIRAVRRVLPPSLRLIAGTGVHGTRPTIELTRAAADAGAEAALVITPGYYQRDLTMDALRGHYAAVADQSPIPLLIYNVPVYSGFDLPADWVLRIVEHPNLAGLKDSSGDIARITALRNRLGPDFILLAGVGERLVLALAAGADGSIAALANLAPAECAAIRRAMRNGARTQAAAVQARIAPLGEALTRQYGVPGLKAALAMQGYDHGGPRSPLPRLTANGVERLRELLQAAELLPQPVKT